MNVARPEGRALRKVALDPHQVGGIGLDDQVPVDQHHVLAARPHINSHGPSGERTDVEKLVVRLCQCRLGFRRRRLRVLLLGVERFDQDLAQDDRRAFGPGDLVVKPAVWIERGPGIERRAHFSAACRCRQMTEGTVADERRRVRCEKTVEKRSRTRMAGRRYLGDARRDGRGDEDQSQHQALAHQAIIDL